jgi:indoleamine 2,3-dioxygenase
VHVDIEARAGGALNAMRDAARPIAERLEATAASLHAMNQTLNRMPEQCSPDVYFRKVRPYIFGFNDIVYEGCFKETPQTYRGETGAQSSIIPTMLMALGLTHKDSLLTRHLEDMRKYMPAPHREFIRTQTCVRDEVLRLAPTTPRVKTAYNDCVREVIAFRSKHFEYAVNYIEKKVDNPIATGGTPYIPWLRQLIEETKSYYLS